MRPIRITAQCELVTPMLSSGADHTKFELRATSVKSGLRFWWRVFQPFDTKELYKREATLFGSTEMSSPFSVSIRKLDEDITTLGPGQTADSWGPGLAYIFFPIVEQGTPVKIKAKDTDPSKSGRPVEQPGSRFEIVLTYTRMRSRSDVGDVLCALWLLENLGGLGGRTRRGAGCFEVTDLKINSMSLGAARENPDFSAYLDQGVPSFAFGTGQKPEQFLHEGLKVIFERWDTLRRASPPKYTAFYKESTEIIVAYDDDQKYSTALDVMNGLGLRLKNYCRGYPQEESRAMSKALNDGTALPNDFSLTKASRGLPIIFNYGNPPGSLSYTATTVKCNDQGDPIEDNGAYVEGSGRRASALMISCHQKGGTPYAVICHFPSPLTAEKERIWLKPNLNIQELNKIIDPPDYRFTSDLIHREAKVGSEETKEPLLSAFNRQYDVGQPELKQLRNGLGPLSPAELAKQAKMAAVETVPQTDVSSLLRRINSLSSHDNFQIERILNEIGSIDETDPNAARKMASTLKQRLEKLKVYKKSRFKFEIECYLSPEVDS